MPTALGRLGLTVSYGNPLYDSQDIDIPESVKQDTTGMNWGRGYPVNPSSVPYFTSLELLNGHFHRNPRVWSPPPVPAQIVLQTDPYREGRYYCMDQSFSPRFELQMPCFRPRLALGSLYWVTELRPTGILSEHWRIHSVGLDTLIFWGDRLLSRDSDLVLPHKYDAKESHSRWTLMKRTWSGLQ